MRASPPSEGLAVRLPDLPPRSAILVLAALFSWSTTLLALPALGAKRSDAHLSDAWGRRLDLSSIAQVPVLLMYEDRDSAAQNESFKARLAVLAKDGRYQSRVALIAVADVEAWNFWPARPLVEDAIKRLSHRFGTDIYCDWDGGFRRAIGVQRGASNVFIYAGDGSLVFAHVGPLSDAECDDALLRLEAQIR